MYCNLNTIEDEYDSLRSKYIKRNIGKDDQCTKLFYY